MTNETQERKNLEGRLKGVKIGDVVEVVSTQDRQAKVGYVYDVTKGHLTLSSEDPLGRTKSVARHFELDYCNLKWFDSYRVLKTRTSEEVDFGNALRNRKLNRIFKRKDGTLRDSKGNIINVEEVNYGLSPSRADFLGSGEIPKTQLNQRVHKAVVNEVYENDRLAEAQFYTYQPSYDWRNRERKLPDWIDIQFYKSSNKPAEPIKLGPKRIRELRSGKLIDFKGNSINGEELGDFHICNHPLNAGLKKESRRKLAREVRDKINRLLADAGGSVYSDKLKYYTLNMCNSPDKPNGVSHVSIKFYGDKTPDLGSDIREELTGETFVRGMVRLEQIAGAISGGQSFPSEWGSIEGHYREIRKLWAEKYSSLDKECQKGAENARKVVVPTEIAERYQIIMKDKKVQERFKQAPILLMGAGFV